MGFEIAFLLKVVLHLAGEIQTVSQQASVLYSMTSPINGVIQSCSGEGVMAATSSSHIPTIESCVTLVV